MKNTRTRTLRSEMIANMGLCLKDYYAMEARRSPRLKSNPAAVEREGDLQQAIADYCRAKGWYFVRSRMDKRTRTQNGVPDFIIAAIMRNGAFDGETKTFWIEAKAKGGKASPAQLATLAHLKKLGHIAAIVQNTDEFRKVVEG